MTSIRKVVWHDPTLCKHCGESMGVVYGAGLYCSERCWKLSRLKRKRAMIRKAKGLTTKKPSRKAVKPKARAKVKKIILADKTAKAEVVKPEVEVAKPEPKVKVVKKTKVEDMDLIEAYTEYKRLLNGRTWEEARDGV